MNPNEIATKADIHEILVAIEKLQSSISINKVEQKFLRSADVRKMLNISDSTLQRLRVSSVLKAKKLNGTWFYKFEDVINVIEEQK